MIIIIVFIHHYGDGGGGEGTSYNNLIDKDKNNGLYFYCDKCDYYFFVLLLLCVCACVRVCVRVRVRVRECVIDRLTPTLPKLPSFDFLIEYSNFLL